ncbi:unnamed protein product [Amoebophrya sp. A25]|nr:unnamed protein product [Amoebophrya sp. A25]|eukprot:GSA25T00019929001.1
MSSKVDSLLREKRRHKPEKLQQKLAAKLIAKRGKQCEKDSSSEDEQIVADKQFLEKYASTHKFIVESRSMEEYRRNKMAWCVVQETAVGIEELTADRQCLDMMIENEVDCASRGVRSMGAHAVEIWRGSKWQCIHRVASWRQPECKVRGKVQVPTYGHLFAPKLSAKADAIASLHKGPTLLPHEVPLRNACCLRGL